MKKSGVFYYSWKKAVDRWGNEKRGELYAVILDYLFESIVPETTDPLTLTIFDMVKEQIDVNNQRYENGKKGGRPKVIKSENQSKTKQKPKQNQTQSKPKANDNVNDNVNVNDNTNSALTNAQIEKVFEEVWKAYPEKKGKGRVSMADKKRIAMIGKEKMIEAIEKYTDEITGQGWKHFQNGSTFFHSGYIDYLPENYAPPTAIGKGRLKPVERNYDMDALEMKLRATN